MNTELLERLAQIDPYPVDAEPPFGAVTAAAVLPDIERRMGMRTTQDLEKPTKPPQRRTGLLVAAAAFAVVALAGIALALLTVSNDEQSPATTLGTTTTLVSTPTTTAAPTTTEAIAAPEETASTTTTSTTVPSEVREAAADRVIAALNARDTDALVAQLASDATILVKFERNFDAYEGDPAPIEYLERYLAVEYAFGTTWEKIACSHGNSVTNCELEASSALHEALGFDTWAAELQLRVGGDGTINSIDLKWDPVVIALFQPEPPPARWVLQSQPFTDWLEKNHPADVETMITKTWRFPSSTPESLALWALYVPEYLASLEG